MVCHLEGHLHKMKKAESRWGVIMGECCSRDCDCRRDGIFGGGDNFIWIIIIIIVVICFVPGIFGGNRCCERDRDCC